MHIPRAMRFIATRQGQATYHDSKSLSLLAAAFIFFASQLITNATIFQGDAGAYWAISSAIVDGSFPQTIRGYFYPLLLTPFRFIFNHSESLGLLSLKIGQAIGYGYLLSILLPDFYQAILGARTSTFRRILPSLLVALIFPGLIAYPLSDAPSFGLMATALHLSLKAIRSHSLILLLAAGLLAYFAYNTRTIYMFSFIALISIVFIFSAKNISHKAIAVACFLLGSAVGAIPQMAINHHYHGTASPLVVTDKDGKSLFVRQLTWGMVVDKYETYIDPGTHQATPVFYANDEGASILQNEGGFTENQSFPRIFKMMSEHPIAFVKIYIRHVALALDARDGDVYTNLPSSEKSTHSLFFLIIACLGLTRLAASLLAQDKNRKTAENLLYLSVLALPCIAVIPGAIETRFFLPIYCISYCALAFESIKHKKVVGQLICAAILLTCIFCFAETSMQSPNYTRPESYLASPSKPT
ncbi:hypothetical protein [Xanthomonas hortorum]|uniref:hypothetical protein n=2 Tax=Xanthomonas hortorum TaxID=56454 RepID=UPI0015D5900B|nr:hypothetical protein [Xanthomonas hortorum]NMI52260.1 hypothetical protein [Xanthomonas hortorum pv. taraxaci]CAD0321154.1 hypothetical protein NCPPB940_16260 [Xanthomonas hortorum pv. taraxaci]CAD0321164.1 hypothetical protein NCPPB940_16260 [Xanthomonas hortorum pv. taraxaci]